MKVKIKMSALFNLANKPELQTNLSTATALKFEAEQNTHQDFLRGSLNLFKECLSKNNNITTIVCDFTDYSSENYLDSILHGYFLAFSSIPRQIQTFKLRLPCAAFNNDLAGIFNRGSDTNQSLMNIVSTAPAFQGLETFLYENDTSYEENDESPVAVFVADLLTVLPNKSQLKDLTVGLDNVVALDNDETLNHMLGNAIVQCTALNSLSITGNYVSDLTWNQIGAFIQHHQTLSKIKIDAKYSTDNYQFINCALQNTKLNHVKLELAFGGYEDDEVNEANHLMASIGNQIRQLVGLSKFELDIEFGELFNDSAENMLISIVNNPTLRVLNVCFDGIPHLENTSPVWSNKSLISVSHNFPNSDLHPLFEAITARNQATQARLMPLFRKPDMIHDDGQAFYHYSTCELISINRIWLSLMSSYALTAPSDTALNQFNLDFFRLTLEQFISQISIPGLPDLPSDSCSSIASYLDIKDMAKLSSVTGGYFFREKKPLTIQWPLPGSVHQTEDVASNAESLLVR